MRTVKAMYEDCHTAATIFPGYLNSTDCPACFESAQVHRSGVNPVSTVLKLMGGRWQSSSSVKPGHPQPLPHLQRDRLSETTTIDLQ